MARSSEDSAAIRAGLAVGLAAAAYGVSYGALAVAAGLDVWQTCVMSLVMFTGGSQFALIGVLATGGVAAGPTAIASAAILGIRNGIYGVRVAPMIGGRWWKRVAAAWVTIDETTAVSTNQPTLRSQRLGFWTTAAATFIGWNLTSLIGALIGDALGDPRQWGLDAAAAAAFVGLLWPRLKQRQTIAVASAAAVVAVALTPVLLPGLPVLVAGIVAVVVGGFNWLSNAEPPLIPLEREGI
ncbi:putative branched-subunit amino acid permease [Cryobacterium mesophilum]|uniref:Branched-chain amino acid ABC transporter permease n=1 Tax=Terrimesophilobacter mesophilus TaxID=433647 RepID=A0A4R8VB56_9MICO|nr:AzlC family ABC transporter permease [Terrimesophilobacter mesophilus]MBB5632220.1 putative branched-subunit amino acid permease [Terrimesophilobacter mesophilus]TFB79077.1 branched-chain amino acid ABC transporter permease [Terrimesophilobacter mesophilus]